MSSTFGVTATLSLAPPTPAELANDVLLLKTLAEFKSFEPAAETKKRGQIMEALEQIVKKWIKRIVSVKFPETTTSTPGGKVLACGSYQLGVHSGGSDIDVLIVAPCHVSRSDFFDSLYRTLLSNKHVTELSSIPEAFVPIMKFKFAGVEIDFLFAQSNLTEVPEDLDLCDDALLENLDEQSRRSLNAYRVSEKLLKSIPPQSIPHFKLALRTIKIWAKSRGIHSNAMGFLGGISWAILVARTCQLFPNATSSKLVEKMMSVWSSWDWNLPVVLDHPKVQLQLGKSMIIMTPSFPEQNSTFNVSKSSLEVLRREFLEGVRLCKRIGTGQMEWAELLKKKNFFAGYKDFLAITATATPSILEKFSGFMDSRSRKLVLGLERIPLIQLAHLSTSSYPAPQGSGEATWLIGLEFRESLNQNMKNLDLTRQIAFFEKQVGEEAAKAGVKLDFAHTKRSALAKIIKPSVLREGLTTKSTTSSTTSSTSTSTSTSSSSSRNSSVSPPPTPSCKVLKRKLEVQSSEGSKKVKL